MRGKKNHMSRPNQLRMELNFSLYTFKQRLTSNTNIILGWNKRNKLWGLIQTYYIILFFQPIGEKEQYIKTEKQSYSLISTAY